MLKTIDELAKEMTKNEFLKYTNNNELCPSNFGLRDATGCNEGENLDICNNCWNEVLRDVHFKDESTALFQIAALPILTKLAASEVTYKKLTEQRDKLKAQLLEAMDKYNLDKWENEKFSISYVKGGSTITIDSKKVKELYPEVFEKCSKTSNRKASIRFKVK